MTESEIKRSGIGAPFAAMKLSSDEKKSSSVSSAAAAAAKKVIIKSADMKEDLQKEAIDCALSAVEKCGVEKDIAEYIKKEFDKKHGPTWHCIVGRNFEASKEEEGEDYKELTTQSQKPHTRDWASKF